MDTSTEFLDRMKNTGDEHYLQRRETFARVVEV